MGLVAVLAFFVLIFCIGVLAIVAALVGRVRDLERAERASRRK